MPCSEILNNISEIKEQLYRVELNNISKSFGGIAALKNVTLKVKPGEIHAIAGENGAGKSTLMKILSGAYTKDSGETFIDGKEVQIDNTHDSRKYGIGIIYQEFSLVPDLTVAENIFLGDLGRQGFWIKRKDLYPAAAAIIRSIGFTIDPGTRVRKLSIAQQQIIEISKALSEKVKILILDEPSAVLGSHEVGKLFDTLRKLKDENVSILYITHHLDEIFQLADQVTVLKDGTTAGSMAVQDTGKEEIIRLMLGRSLDTMFPERKSSPGEELLAADKISVPGKVDNLSLAVRAGEVIGLAGLVGSGRTETVRALFGVELIASGTVKRNGKKIRIRSPYSAVRAGIGMVPEDRKQHGVILSLSVKQNITLANTSGVSDAFGFIGSGKEKENIIRLIEKLRIKTSGENTMTGNLSGGNQQKVSLAKWINRKCKVLIIDEPTRGVDVGAKVEIYKLINDLAEQGVGIIIVSSETSELMGICDRIVVMRKGTIAGRLDRKDFSEENILRIAIGE